MNADSSVQLLAEEAVTLDMLDAGVSVLGETDVPRRSGLSWRSRALGKGTQFWWRGRHQAGVAACLSPTTHFLQAAKVNLEKAQSELSGAADEASRAEIQIRIEANEALVKALE